MITERRRDIWHGLVLKMERTPEWVTLNSDYRANGLLNLTLKNPSPVVRLPDSPMHR